ncbi:MAG TPA: chloride channel protein, partial [Bryobacteraceae bacterium]
MAAIEATLVLVVKRLVRRVLPQLNAKVSGGTTASRMWLLSAVAVLLGLVGGGAAVGLFKLIGLITHLTLLHDVSTSLPSLRGYHPSGWIVLTAIAGALIVSLLAMWAPVIRGHGIPESLEAILFRDSKIRPRAAIAKPLSAAITIGTGGPFGAEGPIIVTGGSIGSLIGQLLPVSPAERKIMLATGAAAGMSATFNAPVASVILAIELVLFERSLRTIVPLMIACSIAAAIHIVAFESTPLFAVTAKLHVGLTHLPLFAVVGLISGVMAVLLNKGLFAMEAGFRKLPVNIFWWPVIGALCFSLIGLVEPRTLSMGYSAISDTLNGRFTFTALAVLFVAKLMSWWISLGSQTSGGTLAPMFLIGATMGAALGHGFEHLFPSLHVSPAAFALVAMAATFGAATKAVFASVVFSAEVTGEYHMIIPMLVGVAFAELVAEMFLTDRLMTEKLSHRGIRVDFRTETRVTRMLVARQVMYEPLFLPPEATVAQARQLLGDQPRAALAVAGSDQRYLGLITAAKLNQAAGDVPIGPLASGRTVPVDADDYLAAALTRFLASGLDTLPVVENGRIVGQLDRADIDAERERYYIAMEARQPGWVTMLRAGLLRGEAASKPVALRLARARIGRIGRRSASATTAGAVDAARRSGGARQPRRGTWLTSRRERHTETGNVALMQVVPKPAQIASRPGHFTLDEASRIVVGWSSAAALPAAEALAAYLRPATGYRLPVSRGRAYRGDIELRLAMPADLLEADAAEGYEIESGWSGVSLTAGTMRGLYNGIQTIRQLLPVWIASPHKRPGPWQIPGVHVLDYPRYSYRGVMLDMSQRILPPSDVMRLIDQACAYKLNMLHLRLSIPHAFQLASDGAPTLTAISASCPDGYLDPPAGCWTQQQYKQVVEHAASRYLTIVPEVDPPDRDDITAWTVCTAIISRFATFTPGPYYNLGGGGLPDPLHEGSRSAQFVSAQAGIINGMGKTVMGWADINALGTHLAPGSVIEYWGTESGTGPRADTAAEAAAAGMRLVLAPAEHAYLSQKYPAATPFGAPAGLGLSWARASGCGVDQFYTWEPADYAAGVTDAQILGVEAALWGQTIRTVRDAEYLIYPRLLATAEIGWSPRAERSQTSPAYTDFLSRVAVHGTRLTLAGTYFYPSPLVPWRVELVAAAPSVQHRQVTGTIAEVIAPGAAAEAIVATVDWGDDTRTRAMVMPAGGVHTISDGAYSVVATHSYGRSGTYRITVTVAIADRAQTRTSL